MNKGYDDDIKIYKGKSSSDVSDFDRLIEHIDFNKSNGNKEKAEQLGVFLAKLKPTDTGLNIALPNDANNSADLYQARVLITFLCDRMLKEEVKSPILSDTARNALFEYLQDNETGYYNNLADGAAFSFYRLALKKDGAKEDIFGTEFAKRCGAAKDSAYVQLGKTVYLHSTAYIKAVIEKCDFKY